MPPEVQSLYKNSASYTSFLVNNNNKILLQAIKYCISACFSAILWELLQLENGSGRGTSAAQQQKQLRDHLDSYIPLMTELVIMSNIALYREEVIQYL